MDDPNVFKALGLIGLALLVLVVIYYGLVIAIHAYADWKERRILNDYIKRSYGGDDAPRP